MIPNYVSIYSEELLAPPTPKMEKQPLSAVHHCLSNIFAATLHTAGRSSIHRWEDNTKMDLQEVGWGGMDWIDLAQDGDRWQKLVNVVMNIWVP